MTIVSEMVAAAEAHSGLPESRVRTVARRLQDTCLLPRGTGKVPPTVTSKHVAVYILALLTGVELHSVANETDACAGFIHFDDNGQPENAEDFIAAMIDAYACSSVSKAVNGYHKGDINGDFVAQSFGYHSTITVVSGDKPAVIVRTMTNDGAIERVFTKAGKPWEPHDSLAISRAMTLPGRAFLRMACSFHGMR